MLLIEVNGQENRIMPRTVYNQCLWIVRDYERLKLICDNSSEAMLREDAFFYADDKNGLLSGPVINEARARVIAIEESLELIPVEYRKGVYENVANNVRFSDLASANTWKKWKKRFLYNIASKLNLY